MKKALLGFLLLISFRFFATHNRAGEITYKRIPPYTVGTSTVPVYTYSITLVRYTDDGNSIADRCEDTIYFGDGQKAGVSRINGGNSCGCTNAFCGEIIISDLGFKVKKNIYTTIHTYSTPGTYTVSVYDPNRNQGVINIPNSVNIPFYIESVIVINSSNTPNSSPILTNIPTDKGRLGSCYYHHPGAYDPDGDSLSYQIVPCKSGPNQTVPGYSYPDPGQGGTFTITTDGLVTWCSPQVQGEYNFAFVISEWRKTNCSGSYQFIGSITRDMQALISSVAAPNINVVSPADTCIIAGTVFNTIINISTANPATVTLLGAAGNTQATSYGTMGPTTGAGNFITGFSWNTSCSNAGNQTRDVIFSVVESPNIYIKKYSGFRFKIAPPAPKITSVSIDTSAVTIKWNKSSCATSIKGYNIYRKTGSNTWTHSNCETGVPAYSGFYPLGFKTPVDTTFTDTNFWGIANGSTGNYIVTAVTNDCTESFADTIKTVTYIVGLKENILDDKSVSVYPNPVLNEININLNEYITGNIALTLLSVHGESLFSQIVDPSKRITIPCASLAQGVYFLRLTGKNGIVTKKIVKE